MKKILAFLLSFLLIGPWFVLTGLADFGDYGGDSDYGGGWDSGDSWDWDDDHDSDYDSGGFIWGGSSSSSSGSGGGGAMTAFVWLVIIAIVVIIAIRSKKSKNGGKPVAAGAAPTDVSTLKSVQEYLQTDPGFSAPALEEKLSNLYVRFQNAWQAKDLGPLRPYMTDPFFAQMDRQLDSYRRNGQTNRVERISVLESQLLGWRTNGAEDVMVARLRTRIVDYVTDDQTGKIVRGSNTAEKFMVYEWELVRPSGVKTEEGGGMTVHNCPNCGAVLNINKTARCEYCGSVVTVEAHDWTVSAIRGLSQRTSG